MSAWRCVLVLTVGLFCVAPAPAILIETKDSKGAVQVAGFLVRDDGTTLTIRIRTADGREQDVSYAHDKIMIVHTLNVKRLEALSNDNPKAYHDYAQELARQKKDPEARDTAMRLFLIAARLAPEEFAKSSLMSMSELAGTPAEARKFRALAYLLDPKADPAILKTDATKPAAPDRTEATALEDFAKALQHYRTGRIQEAITAAKKPSAEKLFGKTPFPIDQKTFLQWCADATCSTCNAKTGLVLCPECKGKGVVTSQFGQTVVCTKCNRRGAVTCPDCGGLRIRDPLPDRPMRVVLQCELWALEQLGGEEAGRKEAADSKGWSGVLRSGRLTPVSRLSLDTVTDIDPRKSRYRNGKWVEE
jgi:hypothetical protein